MKEFPAAHSMDTDWFAVDADGNIGVFDSDEEGAVPHFHYEFRKVNQIDFIKYCQQQAQDENGVIHVSTEIPDLRQDATLENLKKELSEWGKTSYDLLLLLSSEQVITKIASPKRFIVCFGGDPVAVYVSTCKTKVIEQMIDLEEIVGGKEFNSGQPAHFYGLFSYGVNVHFPVPYERDGVPEKPLKVEDLPEELQIALCTSHFENIRFAETEKIQPIEHTKCKTWGDRKYWLDSQGNEREGSENLD